MVQNSQNRSFLKYERERDRERGRGREKRGRGGREGGDNGLSKQINILEKLMAF